MTPEEIKKYFEAFPPPQRVDWKPWAKITDSQAFLKSCYSTIRNFNGPLERCPAWWHLKDFYLLVKKNGQAKSDDLQTQEHAVTPEP